MNNNRWLLVDTENKRVYDASGLVDELVESSDNSDLNGNVDFNGCCANLNHNLVGFLAHVEETAANSTPYLKDLSWNLHSLGEAFKSVKEEKGNVVVTQDDVKMTIEITDNP